MSCESVRICIFINLLTPLLWVQLQHRLRTTNNFPSSSILQVARYSWGWKLFPPFLLNTESKVLIWSLQIDTVLPGFSNTAQRWQMRHVSNFTTTVAVLPLRNLPWHLCALLNNCKCRKELHLAKWKVYEQDYYSDPWLVQRICNKQILHGTHIECVISMLSNLAGTLDR